MSSLLIWVNRIAENVCGLFTIAVFTSNRLRSLVTRRLDRSADRSEQLKFQPVARPALDAAAVCLPSELRGAWGAPELVTLTASETTSLHFFRHEVSRWNWRCRKNKIVYNLLRYIKLYFWYVNRKAYGSSHVVSGCTDVWDSVYELRRPTASAQKFTYTSVTLWTDGTNSMEFEPFLRSR
jgi:hypothetical protein